MIGSLCGTLLLVLGALVTVGGGYLGWNKIPEIVNEEIIENVILHNDSIQLERFLEPPVTVSFKVYFFNISNGEEVIEGAVPHVAEVGPYVYKQYLRKNILHLDYETITYTETMRFEFDAESSHPLTLDDQLTVVNVPYNALLQGAEMETPGLLLILNPVLNQVFGTENNQPVITTSVQKLLFEGILMCDNPNFFGRIACDQINANAQGSENMRFYDNGSFAFSFFHHKDGYPSSIFQVSRGTSTSEDLGQILTYDLSSYLKLWSNPNEEEVSICNTIRGTDSAIYRPFINSSESLFAFNPDICRSVELRYQSASNYEGVPSLRFHIGDWLLTNEEGCYCVNQTAGIIQDNGCLYSGAMELFTCTGAHVVFSFPHFLHADSIYRNGVIGLTPQEDLHEIFVDLEPNSGVILRGAKRAQFNLFLRPIPGIPRTASLRNTLTPILWVEDSVELPEELVNEVKSKLLKPLRLVAVLRIVVVLLGLFVSGLGIWLIAVDCRSKNIDTAADASTHKKPNGPHAMINSSDEAQVPKETQGTSLSNNSTATPSLESQN